MYATKHTDFFNSGLFDVKSLRGNIRKNNVDSDYDYGLGGLENSTDYEKALLTKMAYITVDLDLFYNLKETNGKVYLKDLAGILKNSEKEYLGVAGKVVNIIDSPKDIIDNLIYSGYGDYEILEVVDYDSANGLYAIVFKDDNGNVGISVSGTDVNNPLHFINDGITDVKEYITDNIKQVEFANELVKKYSDSNIYLYGHSLGGNIVEHLYLDNLDAVKKAFVINALPVD